MAGPRRILVVDDQRPVADLLKAVFRAEGFEVQVCVDAESAVSQALASQPDLILLDLVMPGRTGADILRELRSLPATSSTPVLLVTGYLAAAYRMDILQLGAVKLLGKPFDIEELVAAARELLGEG